MKCDNNSFIMYKDWGLLLSMLDTYQKGRLLEAIFSFQINGEVENFDDDKILSGLSKFFLSTFVRDSEKYEKMCETNRNNAKSGRKSIKENQTAVRESQPKTITDKNETKKEKEIKNSKANIKPENNNSEIKSESKIKDNSEKPHSYNKFGFLENSQLAERLNFLANKKCDEYITTLNTS